MAKNILTIASVFFFPRDKWRILVAGCILLLLILCGYLVSSTDGTHRPYLHSLYLPVILAGMSFGVYGGMGAAIIAALVVGPHMPESYHPFLEQTAQGWIYRGIFFLMVGVLAGACASLLRDLLESRTRQLMTDPVTRLLNLRGLKQKLEEQGTEIPDSITMVAMEIQGLGDIERAIGPENTQMLLRMIAEKLRSIADESLYIAHLETGGFILVVRDLASASRQVDLCRACLGDVFNVDNIPVFIEIYFGIASATNPREHPLSVLRNARIAVRLGQSSRKIQTIFDHQDQNVLRRSIQITHDLNEAINKDELRLYYQPKIDLVSGEVTGVEALVRWPHKEMGMVPPAEFIPLVEKTLLINPYTKWLLATAFKQMAQWRSQNIDISMAVNFSMVNFQDPGVLETIFNLLEQYKIPANRIEIEVTETSVAENIRNVAEILYSLRQRGIRIAVDDFGTGQSSLQYLCELPVDILKIDRFFVHSMLVNSASEAIIRSAVLLGKELNLVMVAEGIEKKQEIEKLKTMGCDMGQGFYIAKAMPPELFFHWLSAKKTGNL